MSDSRGSPMPTVSVIMPAFGRTDYLSEAIDSVFRQTYSDFEFILVDDNDPNSEFRKQTSDIVCKHQECGRPIIYIQHPNNRNGASARNTGFHHSRGRYISFLDSDDFYAQRRLEAAVSALDGTSENVGGVYTGVEFRRGSKMYRTHIDVAPGNFLVETLACRFQIGTGSNLFIKREVFEEVSGFDESFQRHQDFEFLVRVFDRYELAAIPEVLVIKNNDQFNRPPFARSLEIKKQYLDKFRSVIDPLPAEDRQEIMSKNFVELGEHALREGLRADSSEMYRKAAENKPLDRRSVFRRSVFWLLSWRK